MIAASETLDRQVALLQEAVEVQEIVGVRGQRVRRAITGAKVPEESCDLRDRLLPVIQEIKRDPPILLPSANSHAPPSRTSVLGSVPHGPLRP